MKTLLAALLVALLSGTAHAEAPMPITDIHKTLASQKGWLNTEWAITAEDLQGRIILLDFWTFCCINCIHVIPDLKYLEEKFGRDLTVIGVHSAKFKNERDTANIKNAILRYGIEHPVVNDFDFSIWNKFGVRAWPTFMLINPDGKLEKTYSGEGNRAEVERDVEKLREQYKGKINTANLPIDLEKNKMPATVLSFPGKLVQAYNGDGEEDTVSTLFVSDSGHHRIVEVALNKSGGWHEGDKYYAGRPGIDAGSVITTIGSGTEGFKDGSFEEAQFRRPQGVLFKDKLLYIADTENHALRVADLQKRTVTTLAGTGKQGYERAANNKPALETPLASPWDLAFYPDENHIAIAMAGTHQLWTYDIQNKTVSVLAGNGRESIDDGRYPFNSLSQPSGLSVTDGKLYFVDSETSSLRVLEDRSITTLIGTGLFDFGFKDGKQGEALMQHALGVFAEGKDVFVADSYNHSIRRYDVGQQRLFTFAGHGVSGKKDGPPMAAEFNEPNDIVKAGNTLYVADTNNHALRTIDLSTGKVATLTVKEAQAPVEFADALPNLQKTEPMIIAPETTVKLGLQKGWHINDEAPSNLTLFDANKKPLQTYELNEIKPQTIALPKLAGGGYRLQGTLYYCEDKVGAQCLIKSFDVALTVKADGKKEIALPLN